MSYEYSYVFEDTMSDIFALNGISFFSSSIVNVAIYVFIALALYTMAKRRGISKAWLAWIPVVNVWILGSLSDQYRYVVRGEVKSKRKALVTLSIIQAVLYLAILVLAIVVIGNVFFGGMNHISDYEMMNRIAGPLIGLLGTCVAMTGVAIAHAILYYMALYDVYTSCEPRNNVMYLVLSIVPGISTVAKPLFLFLCRNKDEGMPPRLQEEPVFTQQEPPVWENATSQQQDPWEKPDNE